MVEGDFARRVVSVPAMSSRRVHLGVFASLAVFYRCLLFSAHTKHAICDSLLCCALGLYDIPDECIVCVHAVPLVLSVLWALLVYRRKRITRGIWTTQTCRWRRWARGSTKCTRTPERGFIRKVFCCVFIADTGASLASCCVKSYPATTTIARSRWWRFSKAESKPVLTLGSFASCVGSVFYSFCLAKYTGDGYQIVVCGSQVRSVVQRCFVSTEVPLAILPVICANGAVQGNGAGKEEAGSGGDPTGDRG